MLVLVLSAGCGGGKGDAKDSVTGKVTLNSSPVAGTVTFVYEDNKEVAGPINPDGTYLVSNPPPGKVKVVVKGHPGTGALVPTPKGAGPEMPSMAGSGSQAVPPPRKYGSAATTDISYEVKPGKHTFDLPLKP